MSPKDLVPHHHHLLFTQFCMELPAWNPGIKNGYMVSGWTLFKEKFCLSFVGFNKIIYVSTLELKIIQLYLIYKFINNEVIYSTTLTTFWLTSLETVDIFLIINNWLNTIIEWEVKKSGKISLKNKYQTNLYFSKHMPLIKPVLAPILKDLLLCRLFNCLF